MGPFPSLRLSTRPIWQRCKWPNSSPVAIRSHVLRYTSLSAIPISEISQIRRLLPWIFVFELVESGKWVSHAIIHADLATLETLESFSGSDSSSFYRIYKPLGYYLPKNRSNQTIIACLFVCWIDRKWEMCVWCDTTADFATLEMTDFFTKSDSLAAVTLRKLSEIKW